MTATQKTWSWKDVTTCVCSCSLIQNLNDTKFSKIPDGSYSCSKLIACNSNGSTAVISATAWSLFVLSFQLLPQIVSSENPGCKKPTKKTCCNSRTFRKTWCSETFDSQGTMPSGSVNMQVVMKSNKEKLAMAIISGSGTGNTCL